MLKIKIQKITTEEFQKFIKEVLVYNCLDCVNDNTCICKDCDAEKIDFDSKPNKFIRKTDN